jgi:hypothetical protein
MTDGAALPIALSDLVHELRQRALVHVTVTAGHAFGGDLEAVAVADALALAAARADIVVVAMGPGVVGTGSALGTTAVEVATVHDLARRLGGRPVIAVRASERDPRPRHRGVSHHTRTALRLCHGTPLVALPIGPAGEALAAHLDGCAHEAREVVVPDVAELLARCGLTVTTMGRGPQDDPLAFTSTAAAGVLAADMLG